MIRCNAPVDTVPYLSSVIPAARLEFLQAKCAETLRQIPGNVLEVGVYKGGSLIKLAEAVKQICPEFCAVGIDTFSGHPYTDGHPVHPEGKYSDVSVAELQSAIVARGLQRWVKLLRGKVEDILPAIPVSRVSFAHVDCDLYRPVLYCTLNVPRLLSSGGIIYFDDYGHEHCPGATAAIEQIWEKECFVEVHMPEDSTCWSCYIEFDRFGKVCPPGVGSTPHPL